MQNSVSFPALGAQEKVVSFISLPILLHVPKIRKVSDFNLEYDYKICASNLSKKFSDYPIT